MTYAGAAAAKKYKKCHMPIEEKMLLHAEKG